MTTIRRCADKIDRIAEQVVPFVEGKLENGSETVEFKVPAVVNLMLLGFKLDKAAKDVYWHLIKSRHNRYIENFHVCLNTILFGYYLLHRFLIVFPI